MHLPSNSRQMWVLRWSTRLKDMWHLVQRRGSWPVWRWRCRDSLDGPENREPHSLHSTLTLTLLSLVFTICSSRQASEPASNSQMRHFLGVALVFLVGTAKVSRYYSNGCLGYCTELDIPFFYSSTMIEWQSLQSLQLSKIQQKQQIIITKKYQYQFNRGGG